MINKEKIINLPERSSSKDKKRRRTTHFTSSKNKKKLRHKPMLGRKGIKGLGKGKKMLAAKKTLIAKRARK